MNKLVKPAPQSQAPRAAAPRGWKTALLFTAVTALHALVIVVAGAALSPIEARKAPEDVYVAFEFEEANTDTVDIAAPPPETPPLTPQIVPSAEVAEVIEEKMPEPAPLAAQLPVEVPDTKTAT
ncbi:MAG: hypothetical protein LBS86_07905, partial [Treponema sp.]|nr:hypothetical protein [Treponema sp.]